MNLYIEVSLKEHKMDQRRKTHWIPYPEIWNNLHLEKGTLAGLSFYRLLTWDGVEEEKTRGQRERERKSERERERERPRETSKPRGEVPFV